MGLADYKEGAGEAAPQPQGRSYSRHATRRMLAAHERARRELEVLGMQGGEVRRGFAVPPPPTQYASY